MPAVSTSQRRYFALAEHHPDVLKKEGNYPSGMSHQQLHDFASTSDKGLPNHVKHADAGLMPAVRKKYQFVGNNSSGTLQTSSFPSGHEVAGQFHKFAKTSAAPRFTDSGEAPEKWQQGAVKRPGALTRKADHAGESPMQFARKHYHSAGLTGQQARYAVNAQKRR